MTKSKSNDVVLRRAATRLAAVQAVYQTLLTRTRMDEAMAGLLSGAIGGEAVSEDEATESERFIPLAPLEAGLFTILTRGTEAREQDLDAIIDASLEGGWDSSRLQPLLRAILRCGLFELLERSEVPARVCISEYVGIARSFFEGPEPGMVNALLDRAARQIRTEEMERRSSSSLSSDG